GVDDGPVVATTQPDGDLTGDGVADPALQRLADHQRLRLQPAALVQQTPQAATLVVVGRQRVLVVDGVDQPLVGDEQQRHARGLVDAAALGLDDAVLDLVAHAQTVATADLVGLQDQVDRGVEALAVDGDRAALLEGDGDVLGLDDDARVPELHTHDRLDDLDGGVEELQGLGLVGGAPDVGVGGVRLLGAVAVGQVV